MLQQDGTELRNCVDHFSQRCHDHYHHQFVTKFCESPLTVLALIASLLAWLLPEHLEIRITTCMVPFGSRRGVNS
jgi:hypothetical protein